MANLKSIKNKYLAAGDGTVLGVTTNTENLSLLSFKLATADSLSKFNLVDGFTDDYQDATGVDASGSTNEARDSTGKYYYGERSVTPTVTGGTITTDGDYTVHKFTSDGTYTTDTAQDVEYLVIAAGGGGGSTIGGGAPDGGPGEQASGGGGGGEFAEGTGFPTTATSYSIQVGTGGAAGGTGAQGSQGEDSIFSTITADGGGGGGRNYINGPGGGPGGDGGSGGGGGSDGAAGNATASGTGRYGFDGGGTASGTAAGGGGGASAVGGTGAGGSGPGGAGGSGRASDILITSTNVTYAGGGGGGKNGGPGGSAGSGGGAAGGGSASAPSAAPSNLGGGGGGAGGTNSSVRVGSAGGSGLVVIRRLTGPVDAEGGNLTLASTAYTAQSAPTTARIILDEYTSTGSATLNTDIKAYASRDNGTTYTQITLASQGTIETTHRLLSGSVDISGQPSGTSVKYKIETLNQSGSKVTRVYGTSMAWA